ncbi:MAG: VOC family protein [Pseudomonadota bacterium]
MLTVADLDRSCAFYTDLLGLRVERFYGADGQWRCALRVGRQKINLHEVGGEIAPHAANPQPGSADLCFLSDTDLAAWQEHLAGHGVAVELGPVPRTGAEGPILSLYLRDPDGNLLEIATRIS